MSVVSRARPPSGTAWFTLVGLALVALYSAVLVWSMSTKPYDTWGGPFFVAVLLLASVPLLRRAARDEEPAFFWILLTALLLKLLSAFARYAVAAELYDGSIDASAYVEAGERLAQAYRQGVFTPDLGRGFIGTGALGVITGVLFAIIGRTELGGYVIFSWWAFWGLLAFYKAFRTALPDGDHRRYALLVLFLPSLLYWPSSIGKDAWMLLGLGLAALGSARLLARVRGALPPLVLGLAATTIVRPHVTALIFAGLLAAYVLRRGPAESSLIGPMAKPLGVVVLLVVMAVIVGQAKSYFGVEDEAGTGATTVLDEASRRTDTGGSQAEAVGARSITDAPAAVIAVLFRPFPWEAHNVQALIASVEGLAILWLLLGSVRRLGAVPRLTRDRPYVMLALVYTLLFCMAFSSLGNFGILTRQRVQLLPIALVLLALPAASKPPQSFRWWWIVEVRV
jgi:hypothetical protein